MLFEHIDVFTPAGLKRNLYIGIRGEKIEYISELRPEANFGECFDGHQCVMLPGFVDAHAHTPMILMRGYGENLPLNSWLNERIFPFEAHVNADDMYWATLLGIAEMARNGITSVNDMYYQLPSMARAYMEAGMKVNLSNAALCFDDTPYHMQNSYRDTLALLDYVGSGNALVQPEMSLHAEYTSNEYLARCVVEDAVKHGFGIHIHLSETQNEHSECKMRRGGRTPAQYLADCGIFDVRCTAAHCVWLSDEDYDLLREKGVIVATCPKSNLKLGSGIFNAKKALQKNLPFAIGTDSVASNNNLNMLEEIRTLLLIQKGAQLDPTLLSPAQAFNAASETGYKSQGRTDCGRIELGKRADLCVVSLRDPWNQPIHDTLNNAAYSASGSDILMTMVDGQVIYREGRFPTINVSEAIYHVECSRKRILDELSK